MSETLPIVLIPGLLASARLYALQIPKLWLSGPVMVADHTRDDSMGAIARRILGAAPPRFALAGHSMGGYISFEIVRQAAVRVVKLALLDTSARPDTPEAIQARRAQMALAATGRLDEVADSQFERLVAEARRALATALGAAAAPLNPAYTEPEYSFYLTDIAPRLFLVPASRSAAAKWPAMSPMAADST